MADSCICLHQTGRGLRVALVEWHCSTAIRDNSSKFGQRTTVRYLIISPFSSPSVHPFVCIVPINLHSLFERRQSSLGGRYYIIMFHDGEHNRQVNWTGASPCIELTMQALKSITEQWDWSRPTWAAVLWHLAFPAWACNAFGQSKRKRALPSGPESH